MDVLSEAKDMLEDAIEETRADLSMSKNEVAALIAESATQLSEAVGQAGFGRMVILERNQIMARAGLEASDNARGLDQRLLGMVGGFLRIAAVALV